MKLVTNTKYSLNSIFFACFFALLFIVIALYFSYNVTVIGDTEQYYYHFLNFYSEPNPFGLEFFISIIMFLATILGGNFQLFLFINYLLWLPIIIFLALNLSKNPEFILALIFFLTYLFFFNAAFLVRQFEAVAIFFIFIFVDSKKWKIILLMLSIAAHFYVVLLLFFSLPIVVKFISKPTSRIIMLIMALSVLTFDINISSYILEAFQVEYFSLGWVLDRKFASSQLLIDDSESALSFYSKLINCLILFTLIIFGISNRFNDKEKSLLSIFLISSFFFILLNHSPIVANRISFITYFLSIPALVYCLSLVLREKFKMRMTFNVHLN